MIYLSAATNLLVPIAYFTSILK